MSYVTLRPAPYVVVLRTEEGRIVLSSNPADAYSIRLSVSQVVEVPTDPTIHVGPTPPSNPTLNQLWLDTG